jgi:large subunit ribosomal protein L1
MANLDELLEEAEERVEKGEDLSEIETEHHGKQKEEVKSKKKDVAEEIKKARIDKNESDESEEMRDEKGETSSETRKEASKKKAKKGKAKVRSQKYQKALELIDRNKKYEVAEALELVKKTSTTKFDGNVEVHIRVLGKTGKPEQARGLIQYPNATGRKLNVVILDDKTIDEIASTSKVEADIYLTTAANMPKVAKLAKILGPKGKMPNPKSGTITDDPEKAKKELEGGKTEYKTDSYGIIHQIIGKVSGANEALEQNLKTLLDVLPKDKINSINLCATMGPAVKIQK